MPIKVKTRRKLQEMILVKGDGEALYPVFKNVKEAFKANEIFKFRIVTEGEQVPMGSELYKTGTTKKINIKIKNKLLWQKWIPRRVADIKKALA